ncbi:MAG: decaprenyl-phosphate phosphoribosyltransferase [Actinomycetota bacterium]|jgi:decaprenyl-phosphate phosphoribosyltransferase|nr:decaprenyl-phosphate phosphoribosyltransferase [Actinomycetota bacterium]
MSSLRAAREAAALVDDPPTRALEAPAAPSRARRGSTLRALAVATRPRQWPKNVLVFAAPVAAGRLDSSAVVGRTVAATLLFLLASAGTYLVNDVIDAPADRLHPIKRARPVARGTLSPRTAVAASAVALAVALGGAMAIDASLGAILLAYVAITLAYSLVLKRVPYLELVCVASGFVLRAVAGGAAAHLVISPWFLAVASTGALLIVTGKRTAELAELGTQGSAHRPVLSTYREPALRAIRWAALGLATGSYGLWAFDRAAHLDPGARDLDDALLRLSVLPFVIAAVLVERALERGEGGAPEELVLHRWWLQLLGAACLGLIIAAIYS